MQDLPRFFPDAWFGWYFYAALMLFLVVAAYIDMTTLRIPKWLTVSLLGMGVVFNMVRGAGLGAVLASHGSDHGVFLLSPGTALGALDGLLFALVGFAASLALFVALWILGIVGGGDVKLFAALGAWVGLKYSLFIFVGTGALMLVGIIAQVVGRLLGKGPQKAFRSGGAGATRAESAAARAALKKAAQKGLRPRKQVRAYALPVAISTAVVLALFLARDLRWPALFGSGADVTAPAGRP